MLFFFKAILDWISKLINGLLFRLDKKGKNPRGTLTFGGIIKTVKGTRTSVVVILAMFGLVAVGAWAIKEGIFTPVDSHVNRESEPGAKEKPDVSEQIDRNDLLKMEQTQAALAGRVDCNELIKNLRVRGTLNERERIEYNKSCRPRMSKAMAEVIDKIMNGEVPSSVASTIMQTANEGNAEKINDALNNEAVKKSLNSDAGDVIARNLGALGGLSQPEIEKAVGMTMAAPPQFRGDVMEAVKSAAKVEDPDARNSLLNTIGRARRVEDLRDAKAFADTVAKALPDEQKTFAVAYEKAPDAETRKAVARAAGEIVQLDPEDPVRHKLAQTMKDISEMPPEKQKAAYNSVADVASTYRTTTDPDLKNAIAEAVMAGSGVESVAALDKRLDDIKEIKRAGIPLSKDNEMAVTAGHDQTAVKRAEAAAALARSGDTTGAKNATEGKMNDEEIDEAVKQARKRSEDPFNAPQGPAQVADKDVSVPKINEGIEEKKKLVQKKKNLARSIRGLIDAGVDPQDVKLVEAYKEMASVDEKLRQVTEQVADMRNKLRQRLAEMRQRVSAEASEAGVALPNFDFKIPDDVVDDEAPDTRLANLNQYEEFWGMDDSVHKKKKDRYFRFNTPTGAPSTGNSSLLSRAVSGMGDQVWYVPANGGSQSVTSGAKRKFEMSRTLAIPGILRRVPSGGIASKRASQTTIMFEFLGGAANRLTGQLEIPIGSQAICKVKDFENDTGRLNADCSIVDVSGREDIQVNMILGDPAGGDGVPGIIKDERGWQLAGIFMTAFSAAVLDGFSQQFVAPYEQRASKRAQDFLMVGTGGGSSAILQDVAQKQIQDWSTANTFWVGFDGMPATIKQK